MLERVTPPLVLGLLLATGCWATEDAGDPPGADAGVLACNQLQRAACRARANCVEDSCFFCGCLPVFRACRDIDEIVPGCPVQDCPGPLLECCARNSECTEPGHLCRPPDEFTACGACVEGPGDCYVDTDCLAGEVCEPIPCHCGDARACVDGCVEPRGCGGAQPRTCSGMDVGCPAGQICNGDLHPRCVGPDCHRDEDCEPDFECNYGDCERRRCVDDRDCAVACVKGRCHAALGICGPL